jgi:hypothetical protein
VEITEKIRNMKKEYMKPESAVVYVVPESMLATSDNRENMGSNETPGGDDAFNSNSHRKGWGNIWRR